MITSSSIISLEGNIPAAAASVEVDDAVAVVVADDDVDVEGMVVF